MIGQAPGPKTSPNYPLFPFPPTSAGGKLHKLTGLSLEDYFKKYERTNLLRDFPGATPGGGDRWPLQEARAAARALVPSLKGRRVLFIGRNVSRAFMYGGGFEYFHLYYQEEDDFTFAIVPHTSGVSRFYNDPVNVASAQKFLSSIQK